MSELIERLSRLSHKQLMLLVLDQQKKIEAARRQENEPIAVVGIGCRFPGGAGSPDQFWDLLREGRDAVREVPADRWDIDAFFDPDPDRPARMSVRSGGFLDEIAGFDAPFFGISPREATSMDPQQRLLLEVAWEALEHAGIAADRLAGSPTGVYVGVCNSDYFQRLLQHGRAAIDPYIASGNAFSVAAGRLAYCLGLQGPAIAVDTSCSASLAALHIACKSLRSGEISLALCGGVNIICVPETNIALSKAHMLAPDGRCKTFDERADGYARGEGCGIVVLRRLSDALANEERILGVIQGTASNQDGRSGGLTVPNGRAQEAVIRAAMADAGIAARDIDYIEAHGTGTSLGDPIEVRAVSAALGAGRGAEDAVVIGSVKTNIGHLESAAGIAGLIKVLLSLQNERIPPHLHFRKPNGHIDWASHPVIVLPQGKTWPRGERRRVAGVSSFGFSGTNVHAIVAEAPLPAAAAVKPERPVHCLPLSARSDAALRDLAQSYLNRIEADPQVAVADLVFTASVGRSHQSERLAVVGGSLAELQAGLRAFLDGTAHPGLHRGTAVPGRNPELVFMFTGQGVQHPGMAQRLYDTAPVFRAVIDQANTLLGRQAQGRSLIDVLFAEAAEDHPLHDTAWTQPALFAVEYGLAQLWRSWGIEPAAVTGHSVGEYVAACVAGVYSFEDGLRLIAERGRLMGALPPGGRMASVFASCAAVEEAIAPFAGAVSIAALNGPENIVVAGTAEAVDAVVESFVARGIRARALLISLAAHSPLVEPAMDAMEACAARVPMLAPRIPVAWNVTGGEALPGGGAPDALYWRRHLREPVRFAEGIASLRAAGWRSFLEVGPHPTLTALAQQNLGEGEAELLWSLRRGQDDWQEMLGNLARLYVNGVPVDWAGVAEPYAGRRIALPTYPFERRPYWVPLAQPESMAAAPAFEQAPAVAPQPPEQAASGAAGSGAFFDLCWQPAPLPALAAPALLAPDGFVTSARARFRDLAERFGLSIYDRLVPELDRLAGACLAQALRQLGFDPAIGRVFDLQAEADSLGVAHRHRRLFEQLMASLVRDGVLGHRGEMLEIIGPLSVVDPEAAYQAAKAEFGDVDGELDILRRCGSGFAEVLAGDLDPLELMFPGGSFAEAAKIYVESPSARTYNTALAEALATAIENLPPGAVLRVLEIGAGTGGTTTFVLPRLPADRVEYTFTDVSPLFLERATEKFGAYPFLRTAMLDIGKNPLAQGFQAGQFDIVVAANVLHATEELDRTMGHVRSLMADGALLFLLEGSCPQRWSNMAFGLIEGWWRFTDTDLRPDNPLVDPAVWRVVLERQGFGGFHAIPGDGATGVSEAQMAIIVARAEVTARGWTLIGDETGLGAALAERLRARGDAVRLLSAEAEAPADLGDGRLVYLGALETTVAGDDDLAAARRSMALACEAPIRWLAAFGRASQPGRAWLVTQGAQPVRDGSWPGMRWQAPLWGVGRAFSLEQPDRWGGLIDLPAEAEREVLAETLLAAIYAADSETESAYRDGLRYVPRLRPAAGPPAAAATFQPDATYLITGGFGGLGQRVALWMAARGARHIALLSRRAEPNMEAIRAIEALGARVIPLSGDVADAAAMAALLSRLGTEAPPLRGIIHAAVDTSAAPVDRLTPEMIRRMLRAKVEGTVVLEQVTRALELDFTVLFSSTTALLGSAELAHYAAANLFLDATAQALNRPGRRVLAVNWGAWDEIRMASAEARSSFRESGLLSMPSDWALDALGRLLAADAPRAIAARIDWTLYKPLLESHGARPILSEVGLAPRPAEAPKAQSAVPDAKSSLIDRLAAAPPAARRALVQGFVVAAAAAVLGTEESAVKPGLDLFEIGMDSLMAIALRRRLEAGVGKALPSNLIFNNPRVEVLTTLVADLLDVTAADDATEARPPAGDTAPTAPMSAPVADLIAEASHSQRALWFLHQQAPRSAAYNVTLSVRVLSALDPSALRAALQTLMDRHAILRTTYTVADGAPRQRVARRAEAVLDIHDAAGLSAAALRGQLAADAGRPFDLASGPVIRGAVYTSGPQDHALLLSMHHIAVDGWSIMMLIDELMQLYGEAAGQGAADLAQPPLSYADYARWQAGMLEGEEGSRLWEYWRGKLSPLPERRPLPIDHARPEIQTFDGASFGFTLDAATVESVTALARQARTTPFVVLLAAFQLMLARLSGSGEVITGTSTFSRSNPDFADIVGNFSNSVPIRGQLRPGLSFRDFIAQIGATVREAIEMQEFPLPLLVQRLQPERSAGGSPLFDTFFSLLRYSEFQGFVLLYGEESDTPVEAHGLRLTPLPIEQGSGQFDLSLQMVEITEGLRGAFKYRTDLFDESSIREWARDYRRILEKATGNPDLPLDALHDAPRETTGAEDAVTSLLDRLGKRDIRLSLKAGKLRVNAPKGALDEATKALLAEHRDGIIAALAAAEPQGAGMGTGHAPGLARISRAGPLPVSSAQRRLWFLDRMEASRSLYNVGVAVRISGPVEVERLRDAARALIVRHESLRMRISEQGGAPVLNIGEADDSATAILRLGAIPAEQRGAAALGEAEAWLARPFDLATGPLGRFLIIAVAPEECVLVASMHHIVSDGWSITIAVRDILAIYRAGTDAALPPLTIQYADYAAWEQEQIASGRLAAQLDYWQAELRDAPALLALPTDRPRPASPSYRGARLTRYLDGALTDRLATRSREFGATLFMSLLTAWMVLMYRYSGQDDIVIGAPSGNRPDSSLEGVIGCLVNIMALRGKLGGNPSFAELLAQVRQTVLAGLDHGDVPFDAIVEKLNPERHANHTPIFQVLFTLMSFSTRVDPPEGLAVELLPHATQASRFDLSVDLVANDNAADPGGFKVAYEYASDLFDPATIDRLHAHFAGIIAAVTAAPATRIDDLPLAMPPAEQVLLARWNETDASHDRRRPVHHLLEMVAARMPDAPAVIAGDTTLSYRALDEAANRLAHLLVGLGVGQGARVAVCLERTEELPVALAAVLKAGAAYVPLDPHHPGERLRDIIGDAEVSCVVTLSHLAHLFDGSGAAVVPLDRVADELVAQPGTPPAVPVRPEDVAYVIYTSGSTGKPKGVQVEHRNLVSLLEAMRREPGLAAGDALLAVTTISFDIAGLEIWLPLSLGGRLVIASRGEVLDGEALARLVERHDVRMLQATPASWRLLLDAGWPGKRDLTALCGGEAMPRDLAGALLRRTATLWNMYGPTETTIWSTAARVTDAAAPIRIGRPIANTRVYVLDQAGTPLPIGVVGELCIGGEGVARGYWKRPELTAERFVTITLPDGSAERVYRTGDDARFCPDGEIDYLGRRDQQVKIRGYRIELGEIEAALASRPDVRESVVAVREDRPGEKRLVGYVVPTPGARFDADAARAALRGHLPEYMVPNRLVALPSLPLTPNGKIDRRALPAPASIVAATDARPQPVMSGEERRVAAIWCAVLQLDRVGLYDNFFDLGGHSMLLIKLHGDLRMAFDTDELMLVELFQHTTVAAQANRLCAAPRNEGAAPGIRSHAERQAYV
jgi:microcystin synthetase protein McyG